MPRTKGKPKLKDLRLMTFERDKFTCQRCKKKRPIKRLTVYEDKTICRPCRRAIRKITDSSPNTENVIDDENLELTLLPRTKEVNDEGYHFIRPAWHRRVYGGK